MTSAELLLERVAAEADGIFVVSREGYQLRAVPGRSGSVCFTLERELDDGERMMLAEGFSLGGELIFDQCRLPASEVERVIRRLATLRRRRLAGLSATSTEGAMLPLGSD